LSKKKILITGSTGQLGSYLTKILSDNFSVIATSKSKRGSSYYLDLNDRDSIALSINTWNPDIIINCAAMTDVDLCQINHTEAYNVNVKGVENLISYSVKDTFFIQFSSDYLFDGKSMSYSEDDLPNPINYYGRTKLEAENILRGSRRRYLIIRTNVIYGESLDHNSFFSWVYNSLLNKKLIYVVNDQYSNPALNKNLSDLIFRCLLLNCEGIYNYGSSDTLSRYDFAILIAKIFHFDHKLITPITTSELKKKKPSYVANRPKNSTLKTDLIRDMLSIPIFSTEYSLNSIKDRIK